MTIFKIHKNGKFAYCSECSNIVKRIYIRNTDYYGSFKGFGWYCHNCNLITRDTEDTYKKIN